MMHGANMKKIVQYSQSDYKDPVKLILSPGIQRMEETVLTNGNSITGKIQTSKYLTNCTKKKY